MHTITLKAPFAMTHPESEDIVWTEGPPPAHLLDSLYHQWASYVFTIAVRIMGNEDDARDVTQDVFLQLHRHRTSIYGPEVLKSWLRQTTVRRARRLMKKERVFRFIGLGSEDSEFPELPAEGASPEQLALLQTLFSALKNFPVDERLAWTLRFIQGEKLQDVADLMGCSLATAKRKIRNAHQRLEEMIDDET